MNTQFIKENRVKPHCKLCKQHINHAAEVIIVKKASSELTSCLEKIVKLNTT